MYFLPTAQWIVLCVDPTLETAELEHQTAYNMWGKCRPRSYVKF